ncbi:MAG: hypothetical protein M1831_001388 [Alyxoria varia]|nr:MAG: hypothetical protein M1831_001388 [Alyxoria varia]
MPKRNLSERTKDSPPANRRKVDGGNIATTGFTAINSSPAWATSSPTLAGLTEKNANVTFSKKGGLKSSRDSYDGVKDGDNALRELPVNTQTGSKRPATGRTAQRRKRNQNKPSPPFCGIKRLSSDVTNEDLDRDGSVQTSINYLPVTKPGLSRGDNVRCQSGKAVKGQDVDRIVEQTEGQERTKSNNAFNVPPSVRSTPVYGHAGQVQPNKIASGQASSDELSDTDLLASVEAADKAAVADRAQNLPSLSRPSGARSTASKVDTHEDLTRSPTPAGQPIYDDYKPPKLRYDPDVGLVCCDSDPVDGENEAKPEPVEGQNGCDYEAEDKIQRQDLPSEMDEYGNNLEDDDLVDIMYGGTINIQQHGNLDQNEIQDDLGSNVPFSDIPSRQDREEEGRENGPTLNDEETGDGLELFNELMDLDAFYDEHGAPKPSCANEEAGAPTGTNEEPSVAADNTLFNQPPGEQPPHRGPEPIIDGQAVEKVPIVRPPFPAAVQDRSPVIGLAPTKVLRTCFRIGEALNVGSTTFRLGHDIVIELYACVSSSCRDKESGKQSFELRDIYHPDRPPYLKASYEGWKGVDLYESETSAFLENGRYRLCRCLGRMIKEKGCVLEVVSIWEADWEDIEYVKGIMCS